MLYFNSVYLMCVMSTLVLKTAPLKAEFNPRAIEDHVKHTYVLWKDAEVQVYILSY
jgi:hypothetical protein